MKNKETMIAQRMHRLTPEGMMEALAQALELEAKGVDIIHLEIGEPDFQTPQNIIDAAIKSLREGKTKYCQSAGIPELRTAIAKQASSFRGIDVGPEQIVVTTGSKPLVLLSTLVLLNKGEEAIYPDPGFPTYERAIKFVGGVPIPITLHEELNFKMDVQELKSKITEKTKLIVLNSPSNPTGTILEKDDLEIISKLAVENDIYVLSDEINSRLQYDGNFVSIASFPGMVDRTVITDGFSKTYAMTGWRLGYGIMPKEIAHEVIKLVISTTSCVPKFIQEAGLEALKGASDNQIEKMRAEYIKRRAVMIEGLRAIEGINVVMPQGAFYAFPNIRQLGMTSKKFVDYVLKEARVAIMPGNAFGKQGEGFVRLSYANSIDNIQIALDRIREAVGKL